MFAYSRIAIIARDSKNGIARLWTDWSNSENYDLPWFGSSYLCTHKIFTSLFLELALYSMFDVRCILFGVKHHVTYFYSTFTFMSIIWVNVFRHESLYFAHKWSHTSLGSMNAIFLLPLSRVVDTHPLRQIYKVNEIKRKLTGFPKYIYKVRNCLFSCTLYGLLVIDYAINHRLTVYKSKCEFYYRK